MSKYTTLSNDEELNAHRHGYRDDPPNDDDESYDSGDEEIATQSPNLQIASGRPIGRSKRWRWIVVTVVMLLGIAGGGKYVMTNKGGESVGGIIGQLKSQWVEWRSGEANGVEEEVMDGEEMNDEERDYDSIVDEETGDEFGQEEDAPSQEEPETAVQDIMEPTTQEMPSRDKQVESIADQEEELEEELIELVEEEEVLEQETEAVNENETPIQEEGNLDFLVGASKTISKDWTVVEQVVHDGTSFT
jgi:hypothetical protein